MHHRPISFGTSWTDEQVFAQLQAGSPDAFGELYDRFRHRAWRIARFVCGDNGRAEDAVQEAFLAVWRAPESFDARRGGVAGWLLTTVRHRAIDRVRRERRHASRRAQVEALASQASSERPVHEVASADGAAHDLRALLGRLPEAQRQVIGLAYYGELSHEEIADHLGLPPGTVKGRMRLGLENLRRELEAVRPSDPLSGRTGAR